MRPRLAARSISTTLRILTFLVLFPAAACADVGIPMLAVVWPVAWLLLLLVIPLEAIVGIRVLRVGYWRALGLSTRANLISTLAGIPVTWLALMAAQIVLSLVFVLLNSVVLHMDQRSWPMEVLGVVLTCPWLYPVEHSYHWSIPTAALLLCIPFYFMSVKIEAKVVSGAMDGDREMDVARWSKSANALSYGLITAILALVIVFNVFVYGWRMPGSR